MFNEEQCDKMLELVLENESFWTPRGSHEYGTLHTLGGVSAFGNREAYEELVLMGNHLLWDALHEEYEQILKEIHQMTGWHTSYHERLAMPGFQIFTNTKSGGDRRINGGIVHKDYLWNDREVKDITGIETVDEDYSATVILSKQQCYLDIWDDHPNGLETLEYRRGKITPHDHQKLHQIPYTGKSGDRRVSMQIRGYRRDDRITLYL